MDDLLEQFLVEGRDLVAQVHGDLIALGSDAGNRAALDSLFRAIHTLKGSVALFDMAPAERLLHAAETRLEDARRGHASLDPATLDALVAVIDQTDRWIDAMETGGALDEGAAGRADHLIAALSIQAGEESRPEADRDWLAPLRARPAFADLDPERAVTAFRYTPDPDCFFRGEDPLALAAKVPDLIALALLPAGEGWPDLAACEPFRCMAVLEGVSAADPDAVRAAFRLVPDQVAIAPFADRADPSPLAPAAESAATLRVEAAKLDRLADQSGELGVAARSLAPLVERARTLDPGFAADLRAAQDEIERVAAAIARSVAQVRLVSLEPVLRRLPRLAREAAASLGKTIRFTLEGESSEVDKQVADALFEPLLHLVRNAIDHGVESAPARIAAGKPAEGRVALSVRQDGENVVILLSDDGHGIDPQAIRSAALAKGLIAPEAADAIDDAGALRLIFLPGFSTKGSVTDLSGRGVGMDAVRATVERLRGTIAIDSAPGEGTRVTLRLPANAITTPLLMVSAGNEQLGIRLDQVVETVRVAASDIQKVGHGHACVLRDATVPVLDLAGLLGLEAAQGHHARLVITDAGPARTAVRVDGFGERFDAVVRERPGLLASVPAVGGTTMLADGAVLLVLDLAELVA